MTVIVVGKKTGENAVRLTDVISITCTDAFYYILFKKGNDKIMNPYYARDCYNLVIED